MTLKLNGTNSEAAPAYAGDDADTGLQCGTDELKLVTGGSARSTVDSDGRLLVGTSTYSSTRPSGAIHLDSVLATPGFGNISLGFNGTSAGNHNVLSFYRTRGTSPGDVTIVQSGDHLGSITFNGADGVDAQSQAAKIFAQVDGTPGSNDMPGRLIFSTTADGQASPAERLRITSDGTIKLGANCPGIDFSQIQTNASGVTSETLDSYEEGTFDAFATVAGSFTGEATRSSRYTKIGNMVYCDLRIQWTGTTGSSTLLFDLPFTQAGTTTDATGYTGIIFYQGTSVDSSAICTHISKGASKVAFYKTDGGNFSSVTLNNVDGTYDWIASFSYHVA